MGIATGLDAYAGIRAQLFTYGAEIEFGDPQATFPAVLKVIDAEHPPAPHLPLQGRHARGPHRLR